MISFNNNFVGHCEEERNIAFFGSDSEELFSKHLKSKPKDWYYRNNTISYVHNMNGHRCKDIEDIDLDNYILFIGCSHTEGIGLELETTYPYLTSKALNCDYYNLGLGGAGIDVLAYNLITWFSTIKQKPKLVVLQWPYHNRFISQISKNNKKIYNLFGSWSRELSAEKFIIAGHDVGFFDTSRTMMYNLIKNVITCPIIELAPKTSKFNDEIILMLQTANDYARDQLHFGIQSNIKFADIIVDIIKDKYKHELNNN